MVQLGHQIIRTKQMEFRFISTRICVNPHIRNGHLVLSYDGFLWESACDVDAIRSRFFDQFGAELNDVGGIETEHYQPKNELSLEWSDYNLIPCAFAIEESAYDILIERSGYVPSPVYNVLSNGLSCLGYEIATAFDTSAFCHGISPYSEGSEDLLNEFGLIRTIDEGLTWVQMNNSEIPEHAPWYLMALYVSLETKARLEALLNELI